MAKVLETKLMQFEDQLNPQHVYCRMIECLKDYGLTKKEAREFEKIYETQFYKPLIKKVNEYVKRNKENLSNNAK
jgi:hypothetical protein